MTGMRNPSLMGLTCDILSFIGKKLVRVPVMGVALDLIVIAVFLVEFNLSYDILLNITFFFMWLDWHLNECSETDSLILNNFCLNVSLTRHLCIQHGSLTYISVIVILFSVYSAFCLIYFHFIISLALHITVSMTP